MMIRYADNPCKTCVERTEDCHSNCRPYKTWRKGYDAEKNKIIDRINKENELESVRIHSALRNKKRKKK